MQISSNQNNIVREKWCQKVLTPVSYGWFFSLRSYQNFFLIFSWSSLTLISHESIFSLVRCAMVFLFFVWIGVLFKINILFRNSLIYWNQNKICQNENKAQSFISCFIYRFYLKRKHYFELKTLDFKWSFL